MRLELQDISDKEVRDDMTILIFRLVHSITTEQSLQMINNADIFKWTLEVIRQRVQRNSLNNDLPDDVITDALKTV